MSNNKYIGALHVGNTNLRFHILDEQGITVASTITKLQYLYPNPGYVEIDPDELWATIQQLMWDTMRESEISPIHITCIGISTQRCSFTTWNARTGRHFHNFITWKDVRADRLVRHWNSSYRTRGLRVGSRLMYTFLRGHRYLMMSGFRFLNSQITLRLLWALQHVQELREQAREGNALFGCIDSWLVYKLTGRHVTDVSNAAATGIFDPYLMDWSNLIMSILKIPPTMFPIISDSGANFGSTQKNLFGVKIPVYCSMAAQSASLFGSGCLNTGDLRITLGTDTFVNVNSGSQVHASVSGLYPVVGWRLGEELVYMIESAWHDTGTIIDWATEIGLINELSEIVDIVNTVPDSEGVFFVPAFSGLYAPINDNRAGAGFMGIEATTNRAHIIRAMLESIVLGIVLTFEILNRETNYGRTTIRVDGGMSANDFVLQLLADLTGLRVERATTTEMSILGVAFVAGLQCGVWNSKEDIHRLRRVEETFLPNLWTKRRYESVIVLWKRALERFTRWYGDLVG